MYVLYGIGDRMQILVAYYKHCFYLQLRNLNA